MRIKWGRSRAATGCAVITLALAGIAAPAASADGSLDGTFGLHGMRIVHPPRADVNAGLERLALTPGGSILAGGFETIHNGFNGGNDIVFHAERLTSNGTWDQNYGPIESGFGSDHQAALAEAEDPSGRLYLAGGVVDAHNAGLQRLGMFRYTPDGHEDGEFGRFELDFPARNSTITDIALAPDGKLIVAGVSALSISSSDPRAVSSVGFVFRVLTSGPAAGQIDRSFSTASIGRLAGIDGVHVVRWPTGAALQRVAGVVVQRTGSSYRVVVAGDTGNGPGYAAFRSDGSVDASFGSSGEQSFSEPGISMADLTAAANGDLYALANFGGDAVYLLWLGRDGHSGSTTAQVAGPTKTVAGTPTPEYAAGGLVVDDNGKIVVLLTQQIYQQNNQVPDHPFADLQLSRMYIRRYLRPAGSGFQPDNSFGVNHDSIQLVQAGTQLRAGPLVLQPDCKLLAGGTLQLTDTTDSYLVARLNQEQFTGTVFITKGPTGFFATETCTQAQVGILVERQRHGHFSRFGRVPLGVKPAGQIRVRWNLRVDHHSLPPGRYRIRLRALRHNKVFAVSKPFQLRVR